MPDGRVKKMETGPVVPNERKRGNEHKLKHKDFCLNIRKIFFLLWERSNTDTDCSVRLWTGLSILEDIQTWLDAILDNLLGSWPLLWVTVLDYAISRSALQPQCFCDSLIINVKDFLNIFVAASQLHRKSAFTILLSCVYLFNHYLEH